MYPSAGLQYPFTIDQPSKERVHSHIVEIVQGGVFLPIGYFSFADRSLNMYEGKTYTWADGSSKTPSALPVISAKKAGSWSSVYMSAVVMS